MPIYEFLCTQCKRVTESLSTSFKNRVEIVSCDYCGFDATRIMSAPAEFCAPDKRTTYALLSDEPMNYSEKRQYMKDNKIQESGDAIGGSKDEVVKTMQGKMQQEVVKKQDAHRKEFIEKQVSKFHTSGKKAGKRKYDD